MCKIIKFIPVFFLSFLLTSGCIASEKAVNPQVSEAREFKLNDLNGKAVSLSDYKGKKSVVLIFWTTWCPYCRTALKSLSKNESISRGEYLELLAINVGEPKLKVSSFIKALSFKFRVLLDSDSEVADDFGLLGVPTYYIIDKSGKVIFEGNSLPEKKIKEIVLQ